MIAIDFFKYPASLLAWFYSLTNDYILSISLIALVVMLITAPLVLKSTKGMLEMQRIQPEMRKLQQQHRGDRQKLNEEMMKLYQEHKVNPLASCLPLLLQMPVFFIMFRVLTGLIARDADGKFLPKYVSHGSQLYNDLVGKTEMKSWGLDLSVRPVEQFSKGFGTGLVYAGLVVLLCLLYLVQQKMVASRAAVSPSVSPTQQKIMQYLPVVFGVFQMFFLTGLVVYYMAQAVIRIGLNYYITHRFYKGDESLGRQAQRAGERAREISKADGGGGFFAQAKKELAVAKETKGGAPAAPVSKRVTPPKNRPTGAGAQRPSGRPAPTGKSTRPSSAPGRSPKKK